MKFDFATANRIIFGSGTVQQAGAIAAEKGKKAFVVTGKNVNRAEVLLEQLRDAKIAYVTFSVENEPTIENAQAGVEQVKSNGCDVVIGFGGGSVIDAAKAIAGLATNEGEPLDYLEVIGKGQPLVNVPLSYIAIPTTSGTGAEVTRNAVLKSEEKKVKVSLRHPLMLPDVAIVDPELTLSVPPAVTAVTGMDALTQVLEPYVSWFANPMTDVYCKDGMARAARSLRRVYTDGDDLIAREDMSLVSLFGGLALANAKLGAVHGFAGPLGGMYPAAHGAVCAALLPHSLVVNLRVLKDREPDNRAITRFDEIGKILTGKDNATADDAVAWIQETSELLQIPGLAAHGVQREHFSAITEKSGKSSSMKGNPITLTIEEMEEMLSMAL